jgi:transketolase
MAVGVSLGLKAANKANRVVSLIGDGEMDEGSVWEALMLAKAAALENFVVIADCNGSQKYFNAFDLGGIARSLGYEYLELDGHNLAELSSALKPLADRTRPAPLTFIRANTTKGFGVKRFVGDHAWHRRTPSEAELSELMQELS